MERMRGIESVLWASRGFFSKRVLTHSFPFSTHAKRCYSVFCFALTWKSIYAKKERRYVKEVIKVVTTLPSKLIWRSLLDNVLFPNLKFDFILV